MRSIAIFLGLGLMLFLQACKDEKVEPATPVEHHLQVTAKPVFNAQELTPQTIVTTQEGYDVKFETIKFYWTNVVNGSNSLKSVALYDWSAGTEVLNVVGEANAFSSISGKLGVIDTWNHSDPSAFANDNPLNIAIANDMHWDWNPGYIFMKVEAKVDTIPDGNALFDHNVVFHIGLDANLQTFQFDNLQWSTIDNNLSRLALKIDMATFLVNGNQVIDLKTEYSSHSAPGQEALSAKVIQNFVAAIQKI